MLDTITTWWEEITKQVEEVTHKVQDYQNRGQPYPDWLQKQIRAADMIKQDPYLGGRMMLEGMKAEEGNLTDLEYQADLDRFDNG